MGLLEQNLILIERVILKKINFFLMASSLFKILKRLHFKYIIRNQEILKGSDVLFKLYHFTFDLYVYSIRVCFNALQDGFYYLYFIQGTKRL